MRELPPSALSRLKRRCERLAKIEKGRIVDMSDDAMNASTFFHDLSRELKKGKKNPLCDESASIARAFHRVSRKVDAFSEKLEDEGLVSGR